MKIFSLLLRNVKLKNEVVKEKTKEKKKLTRKRLIIKNNWQKNKRKRAYQLGKVLVNGRGKQVEPKMIKLTKDGIKHEKIFLDFYNLRTTGKIHLTIKRQFV